MKATQRVPLPQAPASEPSMLRMGHEGVGARRARIVQHHELIERQARIAAADRGCVPLLARVEGPCRAGRE